MQLKRILVSLLVAMMILSTAVVAVSADDVLTSTSSATLDIAVETTSAADAEGNVAAKAGDTVEVNVVIKNNPGVALLQFTLKYDATALTPVKGADGKVAITTSDIFRFKDSMIEYDGIYTDVLGEIKFTADLNNKTNTTAVGTVATLSFKVGDNYDGTAVIEIVAENAYNAAYANVAINKTNLNLIVHTLGEAKVVAPTCTTEGYTERVCSTCGESVKTDVVAATGHSFTDVAEVPATCTTAGSTAGKTCSACGETDVKEIPALGHTEETYGPNNDGVKCSVCGEIIKEATEKASLLWLWIVIAVVVVIGAGAAVFFFVIKKKK